MISNQNSSRAAVQIWLQERFGADVQIGEGAFIDPYDEGGLAATFNTTAEHAQFRRQGFGEIRTGLASRFDLSGAYTGPGGGASTAPGGGLYTGPGGGAYTGPGGGAYTGPGGGAYTGPGGGCYTGPGGVATDKWNRPSPYCK